MFFPLFLIAAPPLFISLFLFLSLSLFPSFSFCLFLFLSFSLYSPSRPPFVLSLSPSLCFLPPFVFSLPLFSPSLCFLPLSVFSLPLFSPSRPPFILSLSPLFSSSLCFIPLTLILFLSPAGFYLSFSLVFSPICHFSLLFFLFPLSLLDPPPLALTLPTCFTSFSPFFLHFNHLLLSSSSSSILCLLSSSFSSLSLPPFTTYTFPPTFSLFLCPSQASPYFFSIVPNRNATPCTKTNWGFTPLSHCLNDCYSALQPANQMAVSNCSMPIFFFNLQLILITPGIFLDSEYIYIDIVYDNIDDDDNLI
ncbi:unnamed protein product [Acanthosepion pharaonis]|uniref:Uncharacterized protein n=1 Tax=Acanthosepion pharaonis TaxID=158019 RepID=A0A812CH72_ACAPH|nr:unnamed protein product [Sepia pharaonis]